MTSNPSVALLPDVNHTLIDAARDRELRRRLNTLAEWCGTRAAQNHDNYTTLTMLRKKVVEIENAVTKAGYRVSMEAESQQPFDCPICNLSHIGSKCP